MSDSDNSSTTYESDDQDGSPTPTAPSGSKAPTGSTTAAQTKGKAKAQPTTAKTAHKQTPKPVKARKGHKAKDPIKVLSGRISRGGQSSNATGSTWAKQLDKEYIWVDQKGKEFLRIQRKENRESGQQAADIWNWAVQKGNKLSKLIPPTAYQNALLQEEVDAVNLQANCEAIPDLAHKCWGGQYAKAGSIPQQTPAQAQKTVLLAHLKEKLKYSTIMRDAYVQTVLELGLAIWTAEDPTVPMFDPPTHSADAEALLRLTDKSGFKFGHGKSGITKNFEEWARQEREHLAVVAERLRQEISLLVLYVNRVWEAIREKEHKTVAAASYIHDELDVQGSGHSTPTGYEGGSITDGYPAISGERNPADPLGNRPTQATAPLLPARANEEESPAAASIQFPALSTLQHLSRVEDAGTIIAEQFNESTRGPENADTAETTAGSQSENEDETERLLRAQLIGNDSDEAGYVTAPEEESERSQTVAAGLDGDRET
ncbi:MAG: hypothetical protein M1816_004044 [Peltula sp. TS41687]|nr:MAG: hypothetical protein M1816_004044 [Peltula sp. TS41687]